MIKMNKKIKSTISVSLVLVMLLPTTSQALKLSDIAQSTSTSAGTWSDPLGGGTYISGGDFKLKLKTTSYHAPLFQFKAPSMSMGCSGISLSGGFISFLGLDKLKGIVSNAGSSLMFGVILGIQFTLPAIAAVFSKIRAWADALSAMMQNGCNIGRAIAKSGKLAETFHTKGLSDAINAPFTRMDNFLNGGKGEWLQKVKNLANCDGTTGVGNCVELKNAKDAASAALAKNVNSKGGHPDSVTGNIIKNHTSPITGKKQVATWFTLSDYYSNKKIPTDSCSISSSSMNDTDVLVDELKYVFFGDIATNGNSVQKFANDINNGTCKLDNKKLSAVLGASAETGEGKLFPTTKYALVTPIITSPKDAAKALVYGFNDLNSSYPAISGNSVLIPDRKIVYFDLPYNIQNDGNSTKRVRALFISSYKDGTTSIPVEWKGALRESFYAIRKLVDSQTHHIWRLNTHYSIYDTSSIHSLSDVKVPLLLPAVKKYVAVIAKMEKRSKGATPETLALKEYLAKINAILFSEALVNGIESRVMNLSDGLSGNSVTVNSYIKNAKKTSDDIKNILTVMKDRLERNNLFTPFKEIEKEQAKESLRNTI